MEEILRGGNGESPRLRTRLKGADKKDEAMKFKRCIFMKVLREKKIVNNITIFDTFKTN